MNIEELIEENNNLKNKIKLLKDEFIKELEYKIEYLEYKIEYLEYKNEYLEKTSRKS